MPAQPSIRGDITEDLFWARNITATVTEHVPKLERRMGLNPEDIFRYIYAVFYSQTYRTRYAEFLKIDFPRVPLPGTLPLFGDLARLGSDLVELHLMKSSNLSDSSTSYTGPKNPTVGRVGWAEDTVWLDAAATKKGQSARPGSIGIHGVPESIWTFHMGGYQVCEKWLKDRKGRTLSPDEITHYQKNCARAIGNHPPDE